MTTLHIEHPITDFDTWKQAFDRFTDVRRDAGVRDQRIHRPVDDPAFVMIDLDFETAAEADAFRRFLVTQVWATPENSPALVGTPTTRILDVVAFESGSEAHRTSSGA